MTNKATQRVKQKNPWLIPLIILIILLITGYFLWNRTVERVSQDRIDHDKQKLEQKIVTLEQKVEELEEEKEAVSMSDSELLQPIPTALSDMEISTGAEDLNCDQLEEKINEFFTYLDDQEYINEYGIKDGTREHFTKLIAKLLENPPVIVGETKSLLSILKNTAHFFRVLGAKDLALTKDVLTREADIMELSMALFYQWSIVGDKCQGNLTDLHLPLEELYQYGGFFLNTLGGQAYLYRRDTHLRLLVKYYSILIIDRSNEEVLNRFGIDIRYPLNQLIEELSVSETLIYKEEYQRKLTALLEKYQSKYEINKSLPPISK